MTKIDDWGEIKGLLRNSEREKDFKDDIKFIFLELRMDDESF